MGLYSALKGQLSVLDAVKDGGLLRCPNYKNDVNYVHSQWGVD